MFKLVRPRAWDPVRLHDWFNLVVLALLNAENLFYLATGSGFLVFYTSAMVYFLLDTIFVGIYPQSVKSPVVILSHHLCTALYMLIPYHYPQYHWCMAYCMLVEVNTWLLIARRCIGGRAVEAGFYVSWVLLRNVWYPYLIWAFYREWQNETQKCGSPWNPILITPVCQAFLTGLNFHWTLALVAKLLRPPSRGKGGNAQYAGHLGGGGSLLSDLADVKPGGRARREQAAQLAAQQACSSSSGSDVDGCEDMGADVRASVAPRAAGGELQQKLRKRVA